MNELVKFWLYALQEFFSILDAYVLFRTSGQNISFSDFLFATIILGFIFRYLYSKVVR